VPDPEIFRTVFLKYDSWRTLGPELGQVRDFVPCHLWFLIINSTCLWTVPFRLGFHSSCKHWLLNKIIFLTNNTDNGKRMKAYIGTLTRISTRRKVLKGLPRGNSYQLMGNRVLETHHVKELKSPKVVPKITIQVHICITTCRLPWKAHNRAFLGLLIHKKFELIIFVNKFCQCVTQNQRRK
jgi:hypothetical protein